MVYGAELNDIYNILNGLLQHVSNDTDAAANVLVAAALEYSKHTFVAGVEPPAHERVDALIDSIYYALDSCVRGAPTWMAGTIGTYGNVLKCPALNDELNDALNEVATFTWGAFGRDVTRSQAEGLPFVLSMVMSELLEYVNNDVEQQWNVRYLRARLAPHYITGPSYSFATAAEGMVALIAALYELLETQWPGIFTRAFEEVHGANLRKGTLVGDVRQYETIDIAGGKKIIKPKNWRGPDMLRMFNDWLATCAKADA
jgi:hypothetical protein